MTAGNSEKRAEDRTTEAGPGRFFPACSAVKVRSPNFSRTFARRPLKASKQSGAKSRKREQMREEGQRGKQKQDSSSPWIVHVHVLGLETEEA